MRLRDFIITTDNWFFSVVSYEYSDTCVARCILRYVPDDRGTRFSERLGLKYRKLDFDAAYEFIMRNRPEYMGDVHYVPKRDIKEVLRPEEKLTIIAARDERVAQIYELLRYYIPSDRIGITGSLLCGLNTPQSDIDIVIYGRKNFNRARAIVEAAKAEAGVIRELDSDMWRRIYSKRNPELSYEEFIMHEKRKKNRGMIKNTYFDILYTRDWDEIALLDPGDYEHGQRIGYRTIRCEVIDASFSFDSPAIYRVDHPEIEKVVSFTHTYAGQAEEGERIEARGMVEKTAHETRLVVGTTREAKGEWIRSMDL